jgi:glucose-6-phosphate isomerase
MAREPLELWQRFQSGRACASGVVLDTSRIGWDAGFFERMSADAARALSEMEKLETGSLANSDEKRRVGHYWLRSPERAPELDIAEAVETSLGAVKNFVARVHDGEQRTERDTVFRCFLLIGIGGSALGPQFVADALAPSGTRKGSLDAFFFDNTDPDGIDRVLAEIGDRLADTLTIVVSKSGSTKETQNGLFEARQAYSNAGLNFARHAVAVTAEKSALDKTADAEEWLERFPMWDWVGGRTSELSVVGLLPARLQGIDVDDVLEGARAMDEATRDQELPRLDRGGNIALRLALAWYYETGGHGERDMVIIPYKDRLALFAKYLQQLVMESLGKERDLKKRIVNQGIAVYGNKGSTDQHSYVQQLRDGVHNFFVTFIEVLKDRDGPSREVEPGRTTGDYLLGFLLGTREALYEKNRESLVLTVDEVSPRTIGALIALYERAVGFYASLVGINAYHQPGVEAGKLAAERVLELQGRVRSSLGATPSTAEQLAAVMEEPEKVETIYKLLEHLAANARDVEREGSGPSAKFRATRS